MADNGTPGTGAGYATLVGAQLDTAPPQGNQHLVDLQRVSFYILYDSIALACTKKCTTI